MLIDLAYFFCVLACQLGTHKRAKAKRELAQGLLRAAQRKAK